MKWGTKGAGLLNIRSKDVRARMSDYLAHDYLEQGPEGWRVTQTAINRFKDGSLVSSTEQSDEDTADSEEPAVELFRADSLVHASGKGHPDVPHRGKQ